VGERQADGGTEVQRLVSVTTCLAVVAVVLAVANLVALVSATRAAEEQTCVTKMSAAFELADSNPGSRKPGDVVAYQASAEELRKLFDVC